MFTGLNPLSPTRPSAVTHTSLTNQVNSQSLIPSTDEKQFTLKMTTAKVVETSVTVNNISGLHSHGRSFPLIMTWLLLKLFLLKYLPLQCKDVIWFYWVMKNFYRFPRKFRSLTCASVMRAFYGPLLFSDSVNLFLFDSCLSFSFFFQELRESEYIPIDVHASPLSRSKWVVFLLNSPVCKSKVDSLTLSCW